MEERNYFDKIDNQLDEVYTVDEWKSILLDGIIGNFDGSGYWVKDNLSSNDEVFSTPKLDATHVVWYNK